MDRHMIFTFRGGSWTFDDPSTTAGAGSRSGLPFGSPRVVGIVNVTPDSFSDGGRYLDPGRAIEHALALAAEGADGLDVGAQSTRPGGAAVGPEEEWRRLEPVLAPLVSRVGVPVSIDTYHAAVARRAIEAGAVIVNDVSGLTADPDMARTVAETGAGLVLMHAVGAPADFHAPRDYDDVGAAVHSALAARLAAAIKAGIPAERVALDPGIGFSKRPAQSLEALRALPRLTPLGRPLYIGLSRKSFLGHLTGRPVEERLAAGLGATIAAVTLGARIVRTHDVGATRDAIVAARAVLHPEVETSRA